METENSEVRAKFAESVLKVAEKRGAAVVERSVCPHCKQENLHCHLWTEILTCIHVECGKRYPSQIPRPPVLGELLLLHIQKAIVTLHQANKASQQELKPLSLEEVEALPEETRALLRRHYASVMCSGMEKVVALASKYAEEGVTENAG